MNPAVRRAYVVGAVGVAVALGLAALSSQVLRATAAPWVTPVSVSPRPLPPSGSAGPSAVGGGFIVTPPPGWAKDTTAGLFTYDHADGSRITGDEFGNTGRSACDYLVAQARAAQKYRVTEDTTQTLAGRPAITFRLESDGRNQVIRCTDSPTGKGWYVSVAFKKASQESALAGYQVVVDSLRFT